MPVKTVSIDDITGGMSASQHISAAGQYMDSVGIDPDLPQSDGVGDKLTSGVLRPSSYATFSGANVDSNVNWITTDPKDNLIYTYLNNGNFISYTAAFGSETLIGTPGSSTGNGFAYYNNYLYLATNTDVSRYGPLDSSPTLVNNVWTGATLGAQTALVDTLYPPIRGAGAYPNHPMHFHANDGKLYFGDFDSTSSDANTRGHGLIHFIETEFSVTEGTGNLNSTYAVLVLPVGFMPVDIESYGTDLVIAAIQTTDATTNQGRSALFFWDSTNPTTSWYNMVWLPDPLVTALYNNNGTLFIWSGAISTGTNVSNGYRLSQYIGGQTIQQVYFSNDGAPPSAGAIDSIGNRLCWGTFQSIPTDTNPQYYASVMAYKSKDDNITDGVHGIVNSQAVCTTADGIVTAIKNVQQNSFSYPKFVVGWRDAAGYGIDSQSTTYGTSVWRSQVYNETDQFVIKRIKLMLGSTLGANMTLTATLYTDDFSVATVLSPTINSSTMSLSNRNINLYPLTQVFGNTNWCIELRWTGTALLPVNLPISVDVDTLDE